MLDGISNALVLFSDPIFLTFYANWRTGRSKRSSNKAAGKSNAQAYTPGSLRSWSKPRTQLVTVFSVLQGGDGGGKVD